MMHSGHASMPATHSRVGMRKERYGGGSISRILFRIDRAYGGDHVSTAYVTISLQRPTREPRPDRPLPNVPTHLRTRRLPCKAKQAVRRVLLFGLAPGDAYPAIHVAADAVGSYPTISPLPPAIRRWPRGGVFSVALMSDYSAWALPSTLPCGVRTFLLPEIRQAAT